MSYVFRATDPNGHVHQADKEDAFEFILKTLRAKYPNGTIAVRADLARRPDDALEGESRA